jgi:hypothetical protein
MAATGTAANDRAAIEPAMAIVRDLTWSSFGQRCCACEGRSGLTPISVKAPVKSAVSDGSKAPYQLRLRLQQRIK